MPQLHQFCPPGPSEGAPRAADPWELRSPRNAATFCAQPTHCRIIACPHETVQLARSCLGCMLGSSAVIDDDAREIRPRRRVRSLWPMMMPTVGTEFDNPRIPKAAD